MFYSIEQAESLCESDPSLIFLLIDEGDKEVINKIINKEGFNFNILNSNNDNVIMYLLKNKYYDLVLKYIDKVSINHQNNDGDTLMHLLVSCNYINVKEIIEYVLNNKEIVLNIKNNLGETILDKSINSNYLYTTIKILENGNFDLIDVYSFKKLYDTYIKSDNYGKYSKLSNLELIIETIENKKLLPRMRKLVYLIKNNKKKIENELSYSKTENLDHIINRVIKEVIN